MELHSLLPPLLVLGAGLMTLPFEPWAILRRPALRNPWLAALVMLPWLWSTAAHPPGALPVQLSFAALTVLMFGWLGSVDMARRRSRCRLARRCSRCR